jgi:hypothetical protein
MAMVAAFGLLARGSSMPGAATGVNGNVSHRVE